MIEERNKTDRKSDWKNGEEVYHWWMEDGVLPGQIEMELEDDEEWE